MASSKILGFVRLLLVFLLLPYQFVVSEDFHFSEDHKTYEVIEGIDVNLVCERDSLLDIHVNNSLLVENSTLLDEPSKKYIYTNANDTLKIKNVSKSDDGVYFCQDTGDRSKVQSLNLSVLYSPRQKPNCDSWPGNLWSSDEGLQREVQFSCITEEGNPSVDLQIYLKNRMYDENININDLSEGGVKKKKLTFSSSFNNTSINPEFTCNVSQSKLSFQDSCSYKPLNLSLKFNVEIEPNNVTISEGKNVTLTCGSDENNVKTFRFTRIPECLEYDIVENGTKLIIQGVNGSFATCAGREISCQGSYGGIDVTAKATLYEEIDDISRASKTHQMSLSILAVLIITYALTIIYI